MGKGRERTRGTPGMLGGVEEEMMETWGGGRSGKDELEVVEEMLKTEEGREVEEETRDGGRAVGEGGGLWGQSFVSLIGSSRRVLLRNRRISSRSKASRESGIAGG